MSSLQLKEVNLETLNKAIDGVIYEELNSTLLYYLQSCVNCKACEAGCPFVPTSLKYSPVNKAEIARQLYRYRFSIWGKTVGRAIGGSKKYLKLDEAETMIDYIWHCVNCGSCMFVCPMAIDSGALIDLLRKIAFKAGMVPKVIADIEMLENSGDYLKISSFMDAWNSTIDKIKEAIGRDVPLDKKGSEILLYASIYDVLTYSDVIVKTAKILDLLKKDWTFMSKPLGIRPPLGLVLGDPVGAIKVMEKIRSYFKEISPKYIVLISGGYEYPGDSGFHCELKYPDMN
ncbi:(Fe-S)-binding protein [Saccharolobus shibatae]|uniref:4Fe-4S ferredoxin-type domain-containing protein n=1 Tax=Saccharolobus shibatae TaxID=2286 RepID=A0A8F5C241_9CREN|nr:(Fe-S)-binding protein [Saccharolobus shibatae]QXJ35525.1 hypothetical protein J5U22_02072 [Saccharolobus shibatae]